MMEMLQPDLIAPIVAWLCHEDCKDNGAIIEAAGGWAGKCKQNICRDCYPGSLKFHKVRAKNRCLDNV